MPQAFGSAANQSVGAAGYCILKCYTSNDIAQFVSVSFVNTLAKVVQFQFSPIQKVNVAVNGSIHVFQLTDNEPLTIPIEFSDLPYDTSTRSPVATDGYAELLSFVRYTLNYHASTCELTTPDGEVETVRYLGGIESFREAEGRAQKIMRWTGQIQFTRVLT